MLELTIAGKNVAKWVTDFKVNSSPSSSDSFKNFDGTPVHGSAGSIVKLNIVLSKVPTAESVAVSKAIRDGSFNVSYTAPVPTSAKFTQTGYSAVSRQKGLEWDINLTLESAEPVGDCL